MRDDFLFIDGQSFRLADDVDLPELRRDLQEALSQGSIAVARVVLEDTDGPVDLLVNGTTVRVASVYRSRPPTTLGFS